MNKKGVKVFTFPKTGEQVTIRRVNPFFLSKYRNVARRKFIEEYTEDGKKPEPTCPTYEVELAGGATETHEHNETTIIEERWQRDWELQVRWREYQDFVASRVRYENEQVTIAAFCRGVIEDVPDEWIEEMKSWEIELPYDDPRRLKNEWIVDLSGGSPLDVGALLRSMQNILDPVEEAAMAAAETFQRAMGQRTGSDDSTDSEADS